MIPSFDVPTATTSNSSSSSRQSATMQQQQQQQQQQATSVSNHHIREDEEELFRRSREDVERQLRGDSNKVGSCSSTSQVAANKAALARLTSGYQMLLSSNNSNSNSNNCNSEHNYNTLHRLIEKSVIIHKDENGFGLRVKGQQPVFVEHVHENGAAWRAGVRKNDCISKVNGTLVSNMDHKEIVLMFKSCTRFVGLTLISPAVSPFESGAELCSGSAHLNSNLAAAAAAASTSQQKYLFRRYPPTASTSSSRYTVRHTSTSSSSSTITGDNFQAQPRFGSQPVIGNIPNFSLASTTTLLVNQQNDDDEQQQQQQQFEDADGGSKREAAVLSSVSSKINQHQQQLQEMLMASDSLFNDDDGDDQIVLGGISSQVVASNSRQHYKQRQQQQQQSFPLFNEYQQQQLLQLEEAQRNGSFQGQYPIVVAANSLFQQQQQQQLEQQQPENYDEIEDSLHQQVIQHERQQQVAARRSESISFGGPSYLVGLQSNQQPPVCAPTIGGGGGGGIHRIGGCERRTSLVGGELATTRMQQELERQQQQQLASYYYSSGWGPNKPPFVCINCKQTIVGQTTLQGESICFQCNQLNKQSFIGLSRGRGIGSLEVENQQRQRSCYGSLREQQQTVRNKRHTPGGDNTSLQSQINTTNTNQQQQQQHQGTSGGGVYFKLSQSASTNSLPTDTMSSHSKKHQLMANTTINTNQQNQQHVVAAAALLQPPPPPPPPTNKRIEIIKEFIDTEKTHTDRLRCLNELFYRPLKEGGFMTAEQLRMVFSCHRTLYKIHRQIYRILLSANYTHLYTTEPMIGSALLEIFEGNLKRRLERAACSFCVAQSTNVELLNKLTRRDTKVGEFLAQVTSQQMVGRLGIKDLLASCFQRLTKYPLLLENLLKATPQPEPVEPKKVRNFIGKVSSTRLQQQQQQQQQQADSNEAAAGGESSSVSLENASDYPASVDNIGDNLINSVANIVDAVGEQEKKREREDEDEEDEEEEKELEKVRNSRRMLAISLAEEREFIERALNQSRQILVRVNESVKVSISHNKLKEIWKRTDKYPGVPLVDITKQQVVHEGLLTLRLSKRSFDVYVLLLSNYIIILTREGQDKYRLKFFTPEGKSSNNNPQSVYSPVFVIDEHLTTRDAATDENGFYLLCKRKDDSRIYEFASRSPAERLKWRDRIQWTIERQMSKCNRRPSCESSITKSSSEISTTRHDNDNNSEQQQQQQQVVANDSYSSSSAAAAATAARATKNAEEGADNRSSPPLTLLSPNKRGEAKQQAASNKNEPTKIGGTISYVEDDGIVMPSKMEYSRAFVDQAIQVNIFDKPPNHRKPEHEFKCVASSSN